MKDKNGNQLNKGNPVWMTTLACTGNGTVVKINIRTCHIKCGFDLYKRVKAEELELSNEGIITDDVR